jgi:site-specific recombinase XerD
MWTGHRHQCGSKLSLVHSLRATAAINALSHEAGIAKVQEWLGHANVSTTRLYDRRKTSLWIAACSQSRNK